MSDTPFLLMTEAEAARLRAATMDDENRLEPRRVAGGDHEGGYVLPRRVLSDDAFAAHRDALAAMEAVALDAAAAWPAISFPPAAGEAG